MCRDRQQTASTSMPTIQSTIRFQGHVQGVGFRVTVSRLADRHPIDGFVRNEPDGSVLMVAQGSPAAIEALLDDIRGAFPGHISHEHRSDGPADEHFDGFSIRR